MNQGIRNNQGKPQWSQIDFKSLEPMVRVLEYGETKVGRDNWRSGLLVRETIESLLRHTFSLLSGEDNDQESKLPHIGHILSNAMFISYMLQNRPDMDNRQKKETGWVEIGIDEATAKQYRHEMLLEMLKSHGVSYEEWCNKTEGMSEEEKNKVLMSSIPQFWKFEKKEDPGKEQEFCVDVASGCKMPIANPIKKEEPKGGVLGESNLRQVAEDFVKRLRMDLNVGDEFLTIEKASLKLSSRIKKDLAIEGNRIRTIMYGRRVDLLFLDGDWWEVVTSIKSAPIREK